MLSTLANILTGAVHRAATAHERSPHWGAVRRAWIRDNPTCAACGTRWMVEAHHVEPFEHDPSKELDPSNFLTLCSWKGHHRLLGHGSDFHYYVEDVRRMAREFWHSTATQRAALIRRARAQRLPIRCKA
jgi:hypothetical protein